MTDDTATQMSQGGWNLVWCRENELNVARRHGLRAMLFAPELINPLSLKDAAKREQLDALIERVRHHPAMYCYYVVDEPGAAEFADLGQLVAHLRDRDPAHLAYINLFPTYANNKQLGTQGDTVTAYREHLQRYVREVQPALISYDHYQFAADSDIDGYFLNLAMIRAAAQDAEVPFLNIVQACSWTPVRRIPNGDEMRFLVYSTLAYGAEGISYYVYSHPGHQGAIARADGTPTDLYHALSPLNREFVAIAAELQPLHSTAVYHAGMLPAGANRLPATAPFQFEPPIPDLDYVTGQAVQGGLIGLFSPLGRDDGRATHAVVVNLDYKTPLRTTLTGPGLIESFDPPGKQWTPVAGNRITLELPPGGGRLVRVAHR